MERHPFLVRQVPYFGSSEAVHEAVREALEAEGRFELVRAPEWSDLVELSRAPGLCVIDLSEGLSGDDRTRVLGMRMDRPGLRVVAVVGCGREARQVREAVTDLICVPSDTHVISRTFRAVSYRARRYALRAQVLACDEVDEVLREALLHILRQVPGEPGERDLVDPKTLPLRTVKELAREIECDARRLRRAAARHGVELSKALHLWLVIVALALHEEEGMDFDVVAWRTGYESRSGLSNLVHRVLGLSLEEAARTPAEVWLESFEREVVERPCGGASGDAA